MKRAARERVKQRQKDLASGSSATLTDLLDKVGRVGEELEEPELKVSGTLNTASVCGGRSDDDSAAKPIDVSHQYAHKARLPTH